MRIAIVAALLATPTIPTLHGQNQDDGEVSIRLVPDIAEPLGTPTPSYRVYDEPAAFRVRVSLMNLSDQRIVVDQETVQKTLRIRLHRLDEIPVQQVVEVPVTVDWLPIVWLAHERAPLPNAQVPLMVEPQEGVGWCVELQRADVRGQPFRRGGYWLEYEVYGFQSALRKTDSSAWIGRSANGRSRPIGVLFQSPSTARERAAMHRMVGDEAQIRAAYAEATEAYARAVAADQTDAEAKSRLAGMLVLVGRYAEAIPLYEQLLQNVVRGSETASMLARAYLGTGDEQKAVQVLRQNGLSDDQAVAKISDLRRLNRLTR